MNNSKVIKNKKVFCFFKRFFLYLTFFKDYKRRTAQFGTVLNCPEFMLPPVSKLPRIPKIKHQTPATTEVPFGFLVMEPLEIYSIPEEISTIVQSNRFERFDEFDSIVVKARNNAASYLAGFSAIVHFEEATECARFKMLKVKGAKFSLHSQLEQIFSTPLNVNNT